jgi:hypothetical protein
MTPEVAGNHSVAANVTLDAGDNNVVGDSDAVYFFSDDGVASEGYRYMGDPMSTAAVPGPGNTMKLESDAFPDGSMPVIPVDENVEIPVDSGDPGREDSREENVALQAGMLTIRGTAGMTDRDGSWKPQKMLIELLSSSDSHIAFTYSGFDGQFAFTVNNPGKFRIRFWTYYRHEKMTIGAIRVVRNGTETSTRFSLAGWKGVSPVMGPFPSGETQIGSWESDPSQSGSRAWWIYQDLIDGFFSTWNAVPPGVPAGSRLPDGVTLEWQPGSTVGPRYERNSRRVSLRDVHAHSPNTVLHEYGHAVMHNVYTVMPANDCPDTHTIEKASAITCAWTEGWANFFSIFVRQDPVITHGCVMPCTPPTADMELRFSANPFIQWHEGDMVEGNVTASLWDFIDAPVDGSDKTNASVTPFWKIWDTFWNSDHKTFHEFWVGLSADFSHSLIAQSMATVNENTIDYGWKAVCGDWVKETDDSHLGFNSVALPEFPPEKRFFCTDNDSDWYLLEVVAGQTYVVETSNLSTASNGTVADTTLTLYKTTSGGFTQLAFDDNGGAEYLASRIVFTAPANEELRVAVRHKNGKGHPFYSYTFDLTQVTNNAPPTVAAPTHRLFAGPTLGNPSAGVYTLDVRAEWTASDPDDGIAYQSLQGQVNNAGFTMLEPSLPATARSHNVPVTIDATHQLQISATDSYGASSGYATGESFELIGTQETEFIYDGAWTAHDSSGAWDGSYMSTDGSASPSIVAGTSPVAGATATISFAGSSVALVGMTAPDGGYAEIYIDGVYHGRTDFYSVRSMSRQVVAAVNDLSDGHHQLEIRWLNYSNEGSSGYQIYLDGVIALD